MWYVEMHFQDAEMLLVAIATDGGVWITVGLFNQFLWYGFLQFGWIKTLILLRADVLVTPLPHRPIRGIATDGYIALPLFAYSS